MSGFKSNIRSLYAESYESDYKKKESAAFHALEATTLGLCDLEQAADAAKHLARVLKTWKKKEDAAKVPDAEVNAYHAAVAK